MNTPRSLTRAVVAAATLLVLATGCSGIGSMSGESADGRASAGSESAARLRGSATAAEDKAADGAGQQDARTGTPVGQLGLHVIRTATMTVRTPDVAGAVHRARTVVQTAGGMVASESTHARRDGTPVRSVLTLRVPAPRYADVLDQLGDLGRVQSQESSTEDVSLQVIDVDSRVASAERTIDRLRDLLDRANSLSDVVALETELARREADLQSLRAQQSYLADQTALSTITLTLLRPERPADPDEAPAGFLGGLSAGWNALLAALGAVATLAGIVLPFLVLLGLLGLPVWLAARRLHSARRLRVHEVDDPA